MQIQKHTWVMGLLTIKRSKNTNENNGQRKKSTSLSQKNKECCNDIDSILLYHKRIDNEVWK